MKILIIGGYGNFGKRLAKSLLEHYDHQIIIAGRSKACAEKAQQELMQEYNRSADIVVLDVLSSNLSQIFSNLKLDIVVNASGPFQFQSESNGYQVARACLNSNCHYIDLADDRKFVSEFSSSLDRLAKDKGLVMVSGASTVPSLSSAVIDHYASQFSKLESINFGISPGNRTERGAATVASILSYTGKPVETLIDGKWQKVLGWQDLCLYDFGGLLGKRWMSNCDIPDLALLPERYPDLKTVRFQAGLEVSLLHVGLWFLSFFSRIGLVKNWNRYSSILSRMSEWFADLGSDSGGMFIELKGVGQNGERNNVNWQIIAEDGVGPNIPTIAAEIMIQKISKGKIAKGAKPCMGLLNLTEFLVIAARWGIYQRDDLKEPISDEINEVRKEVQYD